jgi:adenine-specific DNA-methyltransferase
MPTLHWVGKDKVVNQHHDVPFRVLNKISTFASPDGLPANSTDDRIIHRDNLGYRRMRCVAHAQRSRVP